MVCAGSISYVARRTRRSSGNETVGICTPTHHKSPFRLESSRRGRRRLDVGRRTPGHPGDGGPQDPRRRRQTGERAAARAAPTSLGSQGGHDDDGVRGRRRPLWVLRLRPAAARPAHAPARRLRGHGAAEGADLGDGLPARPRPHRRRDGRGQAPGALGWRAGLPDQAVRPARGPPPRAEPPGDPAAAAPAAPDRARARAARRDAHRRAGGGAPRGARAPRRRRRVPRRRDRRARPARRRDRPAARRRGHVRGRRARPHRASPPRCTTSARSRSPTPSC